MDFATLARRSLAYYWRTHFAVIAAVGIAVAVLTGALLVGDSVRGSLRALFVSRLGKTDHVVLSTGFFRETLASELIEGTSFATTPLVAFQGMVTNERTGRRRAGVSVFGVDERFWAFHGATAPGLTGREALLTASLVEELGGEDGDAVLLRVERPSAVERGSLHGTKEDVGRTIRLTLRSGLEETGLPEFSFAPSQENVAGIYVPLSRLQRDLEQEGRVNTILVSSSGSSRDAVVERLRESASLADLTISIRNAEPSTLRIESESLMLSNPVAGAVFETAAELGLETTSVFTYLANSMSVRERELPYSLVAALDEETYRRELLSGGEPSKDGIVLNEWAGEDLGARPGDRLSMQFYVWVDEGRIETRRADFTVDAIVPMKGLAGSRDLAPDYPGISDTEDLSDWEPPFPIELRRVRDKDEEYWDRFRGTPKAFVPLARGQELWPVRQGKLTSIRLVARDDSLPAISKAIRDRLDPLDVGFTVVAAREEGLEASEGATDFGEYFVYFSYFLVMAAVLLTGLFFKLGIEQRHREIGTFFAAGFTSRHVRRMFLVEAALLSCAGALAGILAGLGYAALMLHGLSTWWVDAVGTRLLSLHVSPVSLVVGTVGGIAAALAATRLTLRSLSKEPVRRLLSGEVSDRGRRATSRRAVRVALAAFVLLVLIVVAVLANVLSEVVGFFVAGNLSLLLLLALEWTWLSRGGNRSVSGTGILAMARLGFRSASARPGRSLVAIALIAFATFTIVAVDAFRKDDSTALGGDSGSGGYALVAESLLPIHWDPNTPEGRLELNLPDADAARIETFGLRPGDDASCLNLYRPQNPRVLAASPQFLERGGFRFAASLAETNEEKVNPWLLLDRELADGAIPVIGDANSMAYVLHLGLGEDFLLPRAGETPLRLRLVATLRDSIFQSELVMAQRPFLDRFPEVSGFRFFLVDVAPEEADRAASLLESRLSDYGLDAQHTAEKLASFHRVENTYLSTFQTLGGLGLLLGTLGLGAILLRNVLERRRELALLRAVGFRAEDLMLAILAENALLLFLGIATGALSAVLAIAPALLERGGTFGSGAVLGLLTAVLVAGVLASLAAVRAALRDPLLQALKAE
jgi:ABC-type antimicrobial peptide transport system permease subunit